MTRSFHLDLETTQKGRRFPHLLSPFPSLFIMLTRESPIPQTLIPLHRLGGESLCLKKSWLPPYL